MSSVALKRVAKVIAGQSPPSSEVGSFEGEGLPFIQGNAEFGPQHPVPIHRCDSAPKRCSALDVLLSVRAPVGALNVADQPYGIGRGLCAVRPNSEVNGRFLWWALNSLRHELDRSSVGSTYAAVTAEDVGALPIPHVSESTQQAIADFLDAETARIGALIAKKRRLLDLLQEGQHAQSESLALGRTESGFLDQRPVDGPLASIPVGWQFERNKTFLREVVDLSADGREELLSVSHLTGVTPRIEKNVTMFMAESLEGYKRVRPGDLVINTMWAWMGALGVSSVDGIVSPAYGVYRFDRRVAHPEYFDTVFRTSAYIAQMTRYSTGVWTSRLRLYPDAFLALRSPVPELSEQHRIAQAVQR